MGVGGELRQWVPEGLRGPPGFALSGLGPRLGSPWEAAGSLLTGGQGWASAPAPAVLPLPCLPGTNTRTFMASRKGPWGARVAFKISLANQIWLFQEAPSLAVPLAGRVQGGTSTFQGPWLSTPVA